MRLAIALVAVAFAVVAPAASNAADRRVNIINETSVTMREFYASNIGTNNWEEDILGDSVLRPGRSVRINIDDGSGYCVFDLKAVFVDGDVVIKRRFNVCRESSWTVTERGTSI